MNIIESFEVDGFWGVKKLRIKFNNDLNFIIGHNGGGKTTAINLLAATLKADLQYLYAANFNKITIKLKTIGKNQKPIIEVTKEEDPLMGSVGIKYFIKLNTGDKGRSFGVEGPLDSRIYRDHPSIRRNQPLEEGGRLELILKDIVETNWLSIHRSAVELQKRVMRDEISESPIDTKLKQISRAFANYFSLLSAKADVETKNFQEQTFLSMLQGEQRSFSIFQEAREQAEDKENLVGVLLEMGVSRNKSNRTVDAFYRSVEAAKKKGTEKGISLNDALILADSQRIRAMIGRWRELNQSRASIFQPRSNFIEIMNNLFSGKSISFDERNIPKIRLPHGDEVDIGTLSSGEKQLFIILGEALLQERREVVFISDEPELSLHVIWQSSLFENIRAINPSCQVITATHSPDIIGPFASKVIKIEDCFL